MSASKRLIKVNGEELSISDISFRTGLSESGVRKRLSRGCSIDELLKPFWEKTLSGKKGAGKRYGKDFLFSSEDWY